MDSLLRKLLFAVCFMALSLAEAGAAPLLSEIPPTAMPAVLEAMSKDIADLHIQADRDIKNGRTAYKAVNSEQGLHYRFTDDGLHVESSAASAVRLQLVSYGYASDPRPVAGDVKPDIAEGRIDYHYAGLSEWFINSPYGLEHGFTLDNLPAPIQARAPGESHELVLQLAYSSELEARVMRGSRGVQFLDTNGKSVYRYSRLAAWDAEGRPLTASMHAEDNRLALHVDVQGAKFPVTVDPLFENETKLIGSFPSGADRFGFSVSVDGEWMAIGARRGERLAVADTGAVYMFRRIGAQWTQFVPQLGNGILDGNQVVGASFGHSVAIRRDSISGNPLLVVGATGENNTSGAVYVYEFGLHCYDSESASFYECWGNKTRLVGSLVGASDSFGYSVAVTEDIIVVGANYDEAPDGIEPATADTGAVYIYKCTSVNTVSTPYCESWVEQKQLVPSGAASVDVFGSDVDIDGDVIVIGSHLNDSAGSGAGAVYVYRWQFSHWLNNPPFLIPVYDWLFEQKITGAAIGDQFGYSVAVSGDEMVVGAWKADVGGLAQAGATRVYSWTIANGWTLSDTLAPLQADNTTSDMAIDDRFGTSVDFVTGSYPGQGDYILVGAYRNDDNGSDTGSAYLFQRDANGWQQIKKLTASDGAAGDIYGISAAMDANTLVIGAYQDDDNGSNSGSAYVYNAPAATSLDLQLSSNSLAVGNTAITATITLGVAGIAAPDAMLAGQTVVLETTDPNNVNGSIPLITDNNGVASVATSFPVVGSWMARASYAGNVGLEWAATGTLEQEVTVNAHAGYAVIIEGSRFADGSAQELSVEKSADYVNRTLLARGFTSDRIFYFGQAAGGDVDALATGSNLNNYLLSTNPGDGLDSLRELSQATAAPLHVFLVGQAQPGGVLYLNPDNGPAGQPETLSAGQLDGMLDTLELDPGMQAQPRTITVATPYSGGFIPLLSSATPAGRIVLASTTASGPAFQGPEEQDGVAPASLFLGELVSRLAEGNDLRSSYRFASSQAATFSRADDSNLTAAGQFVDNALQKALLDDNGDGVGSHRLSIGSVGGVASDGAVASSVYLGIGNTDSNDFQVTDTQFLAAPGSPALTVIAENGQTSPAWTVAIRDPGTLLSALPGEEHTSLPYTRLDMIQLTDTVFYVGNNFSQPGKYEIWYWGEDAIDGRETLSKRSVVYVDNPGNQAPTAAVINYPVNGETNIGTRFEVDWQPSTDADGDAVTYRMLISTSSALSGGVLDPANVQFKVDEVGSSHFSVGAEANLAAGTRYYWQLLSIDRWGLLTPGGIGDFTPGDPRDPNSFTRLFGGTVTDGGGAALAGATVTWESATVASTNSPAGNYIVRPEDVTGIAPTNTEPCWEQPQYIGNVKAGKVDYDDSPTTTLGVYPDYICGSMEPGEFVDFSLSASGAPADSDGDGLTDAVEAVIGTNPLVADHDGDGISDYDEVNYDGMPGSYTPGADLSPWASDTDGDGVSDYVEVNAGSNPLDSGDVPVWGDTNGDGQVDTADVLLATQYALGLAVPDTGALLRSDIAPLIGGVPATSPNGQIDIADLLLIQRKVLVLVSF